MHNALVLVCNAFLYDHRSIAGANECARASERANDQLKNAFSDTVPLKMLVIMPDTRYCWFFFRDRVPERDQTATNMSMDFNAGDKWFNIYIYIFEKPSFGFNLKQSIITSHKYLPP